jgi:hypothetical protein
VTITRVQVSPDLQHARIHYTSLGDDKARAATAKALGRASVFLRRQIGSRLRLSVSPSSSSSTTSRLPARIGSSSSPQHPRRWIWRRRQPGHHT